MKTDHGAIGPALGYYYQAIFALVTLFDSENDNAFVSIESFDDVYHEDGKQKNLFQLKHTIQVDTKISIKSDQLWKTLKVWCDFIITNDPADGIFTLSTVASLDSNSPLNALKDENSSRDILEIELLKEAQRVSDERAKIMNQNKTRISNGEKEEKLPHEGKHQGCKAFIALDKTKRKTLLQNIRINSSAFTITEAKNEVIERIKYGTGTQSKNYESLSESIIAWWDREAVKSLTKERKDCIYRCELQEFISKKNSELYNDGFTDDLDYLEIPISTSNHPIMMKQLEIINASPIQKKRSLDTEIRARIQREKWMKDNLPAASKLSNYDEELVREWHYKFEEIKEESNTFPEELKKEKGRNLLNWSHEDAHKQVNSISNTYSNLNLIRGSFQILSKDKRVGWHCDFDSLIHIEGD